MRERELRQRKELAEKGVAVEEMDKTRKKEDSCFYCNALCYLSVAQAKKTNKLSCLFHVAELGDPADCRLLIRVPKEELDAVVEEVTERAEAPQVWIGKLKALLEDNARPSLKALYQLHTDVILESPLHNDSHVDFRMRLCRARIFRLISPRPIPL